MKKLILLMTASMLTPLIASQAVDAPKPPAATPDDRGSKFDKIDKEKAGKVTREQYIKSQKVAEEAAIRFDKWDTDKDGFLTRDEYLKVGKTKKAPAEVSPAKPDATSPGSTDERGTKFDNIDKEKAGKVTREQYIKSQKVAEEAATRFDKWDADKDGTLTRQEFITQGGKINKGQ